MIISPDFLAAIRSWFAILSVVRPASSPAAPVSLPPRYQDVRLYPAAPVVDGHEFSMRAPTHLWECCTTLEHEIWEYVNDLNWEGRLQGLPLLYRKVKQALWANGDLTGYGAATVEDIHRLFDELVRESRRIRDCNAFLCTALRNMGRSRRLAMERAVLNDPPPVRPAPAHPAWDQRHQNRLNSANAAELRNLQAGGLIRSQADLPRNATTSRNPEVAAPDARPVDVQGPTLPAEIPEQEPAGGPFILQPVERVILHLGGAATQTTAFLDPVATPASSSQDRLDVLELRPSASLAPPQQPATTQASTLTPRSRVLAEDLFAGRRMDDVGI